ncbi:MAG: hypothetical protein ABSA96_14660 [Candidatus Acidiferrales bacterium]|jgi:hypothetical protein
MQVLNSSHGQPGKWPRKRLQGLVKIFATTALAFLALLSFKGARISAQGLPPIIGRIEGDDVEVVTATPTGVEKDAAPTVVASGSQVTLRSGHALILLDAGGEISICGPARFKTIKAAGSVTLALDYGRVHPSLDSADTLTIYTPTVIATPVAISNQSRDMTLGLEQSGEMCILTKTGAMRVAPQFSDQSLIVPQGGTVTLSGGQIESLHGDVAACSCEFSRASLRHTEPSAPAPASASISSPPPAREISELIRPMQPEPKKAEDSPMTAPSAAEPVYTVIMPALSFDANAPILPPTPDLEPDPETILLVREVRLRPAIVFRGHVNPAPEPPTVAPSSASTAPRTSPGTGDARPGDAQPGILDRMRNFFHKLAGRSPCAGAGCSG